MDATYGGVMDLYIIVVGDELYGPFLKGAAMRWYEKLKESWYKVNIYSIKATELEHIKA